SELLRRLEGGSSARVPPAELLEPLSAREGEVLRFLPTMMSNADIASELFVSVNTVKTHVKSIYRKLEVTRRQDAVRRARQLHILWRGRRTTQCLLGGAALLGRRRADRDEIRRMDPGVGDVEPAGVADRVAQRDRPAVLEQRDGRGGSRRDHVVDVP